MRAIKIFLLILLSLFIIFLLSVSIIGASLQTLLYPSVYEESFQKNNIYSQLNNLAGPNNQFFIVIPNNDPQLLFNSLLNNFLSYLRGNSDQLNLTVEIDQTALRQFFENSAANFTVCAPGQEPFTGEEINCRPATQNSSEFIDEVLERKKLPFFDQKYLNLATIYDPQGNLNKFVYFIKIYKYILYGSLLLTIIFIFFIYLLNKDIKKSFRWYFVDFIVAGGISLSIAFILGKLLDSQLRSIDVILVDIVADIANNILYKINFYSIIIILLGIVFLGLSFIHPNKEKDAKKT